VSLCVCFFVLFVCVCIHYTHTSGIDTVCIYVCIYIYICMYVYVCKYVYIYVYTSGIDTAPKAAFFAMQFTSALYVPVFTCVCWCVRVVVCACSCVCE